jgi:hypothetical protein
MNSSIICCKEEFKVFYTCSEGCQNYTYCFDCDFIGFPYEKVVYAIEGTREEEDDGFINIIETYDYYPYIEGRRIKHRHISLRLQTYEEAEALLEKLDDDISTQLEYDTVTMLVCSFLQMRSDCVITTATTGEAIPVETLMIYHTMGFKLVPLTQDSKTLMFKGYLQKRKDSKVWKNQAIVKCILSTIYIIILNFGPIREL